LAELFGTAKELYDFAGLTMVRYWRNPKNVGQHELRVAVLRIFLEELIKDLPGLGSILLKEVLSLLLQALGSLAPRAKRRIERQVAEKIERVRVWLFRLLGEFLKADSALGKGLDDLATLLRFGPASA
jgi:hypothetical protein